MKPLHYYNEFDRKAAAWLRELMADGLIPEGVVDERSIVDVRPDDLAGYVQCHFFAGIGGWSAALRIANWPENKPVWTASCPCQPFSQAGKGLGTADPRHLWPVLRRLVGRCKPPVIFGEQVASAAGRVWLAGVRANLARLGYAVGASDLCAASVGAPQIRQRLYWVANRHSERRDGQQVSILGRQSRQESIEATRSGGPNQPDRLLGNSNGEQVDTAEPRQSMFGAGLPSGSVADSNGGNASAEGLQRSGEHGQRSQDGCSRGLENANGGGFNSRRGDKPKTSQRESRDSIAEQRSSHGGMGDSNDSGFSEQRGAESIPPEQPPTQLRGNYGFWSNSIWHNCTDGKARRISPEPEIFPLAHGIPGRVGLLRGAGNAIVPELAAEFVQAFRETEG